MVLIISDEMDFSTNEIIDWLLYYKKEFYKINNTDNVRIKNINISSKGNLDFNLVVNDKDEIKFSSISSYWYRRGTFTLSYKVPAFFNECLNFIEQNLREDISSNVRFLHTSLFLFKKGFGFFYDNFTNKLINLLIASDCGLKVPNTLLCDNKQEIKEFLKNKKNIITKTGDIPIYFEDKKHEYISGTVEFSESDLNEITDYFYPSVFQNLLVKKYELRIFYLNDKLYPMAIFSQNDEQTKIDFRNYNWEKLNRTVPYKLPDKIGSSLIMFMNRINMKSGSIDVVYTTDNEYVFLEVNPVGQFKQVSRPCNYNLEKIIADQLM